MELPRSAFLIVIVYFGKYTNIVAKDTRRILMGVRTPGLPAYVKKELKNIDFSPKLYALVRSRVEGIRRATGGLAIYHYRIEDETAEKLLKHVKEYLDERIKRSDYLDWRKYDLLIARWL